MEQQPTALPPVPLPLGGAVGVGYGPDGWIPRPLYPDTQREVNAILGAGPDAEVVLWAHQEQRAVAFDTAVGRVGPVRLPDDVVLRGQGHPEIQWEYLLRWVREHAAQESV